jgi:hypothetical protein
MHLHGTAWAGGIDGGFESARQLTPRALAIADTVGSARCWSGLRPGPVPNELVAVDGLAGATRAVKPGEVKRPGNEPVIVPLAAEGCARVKFAAPGETAGRALGPLEAPAAAPPEVPRGTGGASRETERRPQVAGQELIEGLPRLPDIDHDPGPSGVNGGSK